eukprot:COSAG01_NODE_21158_length_915_cov_1.534314_2_plen_131_part_00
MAVSLEDLGFKHDDATIQALAVGLHEANALYLSNDKAPSRKVNELDNRGTHFYIALYWAQALAKSKHVDLSAKFVDVAEKLAAEEAKIVEGLNKLQGEQVDIGGYYRPSVEKLAKVMRPCDLFNQIIDSL